MFEQALQKQLFSKEAEKTSIDKLLARNEVERVKVLIRMPTLGRENVLELLYLCLGTESKLLNLSSWDRYVILKFFVWIREFTKLIETMYDHQENLEKRETAGEITISKRTKQMLENNNKHMEHNAKFLVDLYLNIGRTSLSLGGTAFLELLKNKFELLYNQPGAVNTPLDQPPKKGVWGRMGGR